MGSRVSYAGGVRLVVSPYRIHYLAGGQVAFARGLAGNAFRGALGHALKATPLYASVFAPSSNEGPSGLRDRPRPFVLRAHHLEGCRFAPGEPFHVDLHLFCPPDVVVPSLARAFEQAGAEGIGVGRGQARLVEFAALPCPELPLSRLEISATSAQIDFQSPTELKHDGGIARKPLFPVLFPRVRDRISSLCHFYGEGFPEVDFAALGEAANEVQLITNQLVHQTVTRHSSRTGQSHPLGGFTGLATYRGPLGPFLPWLAACAWAGVGRHTVWGQGAYSLTWDG